MCEYKCEMLKMDMEYEVLPSAFYLSHNYQPQDIDKKMRQNFFREVRQLIDVLPNFKYLLLAMMCAPYLSDMLMFHFYVPDEDCRTFIVYLTTVLYGDINSQTISSNDMDDSNLKIHHNKAYCLNRYQYHKNDDVRLLHKMIRKEKEQSVYRCAEAGNNAIIIAANDEDRQLYYDSKLREIMLIFSADILECGENKHLLKKFITNCVLQYHYILNSVQNRDIDKKIKDCGEAVEYSEKIVMYMLDNPHLRNQVKALYSAAALTKALFRVEITSDEVDRIIVNNFELYKKTKYPVDLLLCNSSLMPMNNYSELQDLKINKIPSTSVKEWIHAEVYECIARLQSDYACAYEDYAIHSIFPSANNSFEEGFVSKLLCDNLTKTENDEVVIGRREVYGKELEYITLYLYNGDITLP